MGLDSVELVIEIEDYFGISFDQAEIEQVNTVGQMVAAVAARCSVTDDGRDTAASLLKRLHEAMQFLLPAGAQLMPDELVAKWLPEGDAAAWQMLEERLNLRIPRPYRRSTADRSALGSWWQRLRGGPVYRWENLTAADFVAGIAASNLEELFGQKACADRYRIYLAVYQLLLDKVGIHCYVVRRKAALPMTWG